MENQMSFEDLIPKESQQNGKINFPKLKNMEERDKFVRNYKTWPVWCENINTQETFYKFELPNGAAIVVKYYPVWLDWQKKESHGERFYLLKPGYKCFANNEINMSSLKEYLKDIQK